MGPFSKAVSRLQSRKSALVIAGTLPSVNGGDDELRLLQLLQCLKELGCHHDLAVLVPGLQFEKRHQALENTGFLGRELHVFPHPSDISSAWNVYFKMRGWIRKRQVGDSFDCPSPWRRQIERLCRRRRHDTVIVQGLSLARLIDALPSDVLKVLDVADVESFLPARLDDESPAIPRAPIDLNRQLALLKSYDRVLVPCRQDARTLRAAGYSRALVVGPHAAQPAEYFCTAAAPVRPPRLMQVISDAPSDLDSARYFRMRILPRIRRRHPSVRYRVAGLGVRSVEPGPDLELVEDGQLDAEYRAAAAVVSGHRSARRVHFRNAEALARGKPLIATACGAHGLELSSPEQALIVGAPDQMADAAISLLSDNSLRAALETEAARFAASSFGKTPVLALQAALGFEQIRIEDGSAVPVSNFLVV